VKGTENECISCKNSEFTIITNKLRHNISRRVLSCNYCGLVFLESTDKDDLGEYYRGNYRSKHSPIINREVSPSEHYDLVSPYQSDRVEMLKPYLHKDMTLLEIGPSSGAFLDAVSPYVKKVSGLELNSNDADFIRSKRAITIYEKPLADLEIKNESFDAVVLFEVLEHIPSPDKFMLEIKRILKPNGVVVIEVPNHNDVLLQWKNKGYFDFYYRVPHLYYFNSGSLLRMAKQCGFKSEIIYNQQYSIFNHLNWHFTGKPMSSITGARSGLSPITLEEDQLGSELESFFSSIDEMYKNILKKNGATDMITMIGYIN